MCGRFAQYSSLGTLKKYFAVDAVETGLMPRYNIAPSAEISALINLDVNRLVKLYWGLIPFWAKDDASKIINARAETVATKPSFKESFKQRRCLIFADGFYEWEKKSRQPWFFHLPSKEPFAFAGIWDRWKRGKPVSYGTCAIITNTAGETVRDIHHRMPVILRPESCNQWLTTGQPFVLDDFLNKNQIKELDRFQVSTYVNSTGNDDANCIEPAST
jgi:putative SOS response-associated peptidase YedK